MTRFSGYWLGAIPVVIVMWVLIIADVLADSPWILLFVPLAAWSGVLGIGFMENVDRRARR